MSESIKNEKDMPKMCSSKKIIQFIYGMSVGGAQTVVRDYATELKSRGYDVKILTLYRYPDSSNEKVISDAEIPIIDVWGTASRKIGFRIKIKLFGRLLAYRKIKKLICKEKPDIIHVHLQLMKYLYPVRKYLKKTGIVYTCHSEVERIFDHTQKGNEEDERCLRWFIKNRPVKIIALHSRMKEELRRQLETESVEVLYNPVNITKIKNPKYSKEFVRKNLGIPKGAYVIGHIGRFTKVKNQEFLVRIFKKCIEEKENAFLLLVGSGHLLRQIKDQIKLLGIENHTLILSNRGDIPEILTAIDVFVFPSLYEGIGIALLEAQVAGKPCIISNSIPEETICSDYVQSIGLDEEEEKWVEAINKPVKVSGSKKNDINTFDINKIMEQLEDIYNTF